MSDDPLIITQREIYNLVVEVRDDVRAMKEVPTDLASLEIRVREIEQRENLSRRVETTEAELNDMRDDIQDLQRKVWAIPGASVVISGAALAVVLITKF